MTDQAPPSPRARARRVAARGLNTVRQAGVDLGLRPYQTDRWSLERWGEAYGRREFAYQGDVVEAGRYGALLGYLRRRRPGRILDVGCGEGLFRRFLAEGDFVSYLGVDIAAGAIEQATALADDRTSFAVAELPGPDLGPFDVVVLNEVLYYLPSADEFLERVGRLLSEDAAVLTSIWRHSGDRALWRTLDRHLRFVDAVRVRSERSPYNRRGWRVSLHLAR